MRYARTAISSWVIVRGAAGSAAGAFLRDEVSLIGLLAAFGAAGEGAAFAAFSARGAALAVVRFGGATTAAGVGVAAGAGAGAALGVASLAGGEDLLGRPGVGRAVAMRRLGGTLDLPAGAGLSTGAA